MKLRNKKTGEIKMASPVYVQSLGEFNSLAELNEGWEDYHEEPKEYYYIDDTGVIEADQVLCSEINMRKSFGNYFSSKEEAEKAVEKLRAWKRLKDIGFKFIGKSYEYKEEKNFGSVFFETGSHEKIREVYEDIVYFYDDIDIIFGGNE